jgi:hypothetical protein
MGNSSEAKQKLPKFVNMKTSLLIFLLINSSFQSAVPPQKVINTLNQKFPSAENIKWYKIGHPPDYWEADFNLGGKKATASFKLDGKWFETTLEIPGKDLIEIIKSAVARDYPKCNILSAIITESKDFTWYLVKIKCGNTELEVGYDYHGMSFPPKIT